MAIDLTILTEGDLHDIGETVRNVTSEALQEFMMGNQTILGALRAKLQELQVWSPQEGTLSTHILASTSTSKQMLHARMANIIVLPEAVLVSSNAMDHLLVSMMKGLGLNLVALPSETLY